MIPGSGRGEFHEVIEVHRGADCVRAEAGGGRLTGRGGVPQGWHQRCYILQLKEEACGVVADGDEAASAA